MTPPLSYDLGALDNAARAAHQQGLYPVSSMLKRFMREVRIARGEPVAALASMQDLDLATLAGVRHRWRRLVSEPELRAGGPRLAYTYANYLAGRGDDPHAVLALADDLFASSSARARSVYASDRILRHTQIERLPILARRAVDITRTGDPYRFGTARVLTSTVLVDHGQWTAARDTAEDLLADDETSWLYRAEAWLVRARTLLDAQGVAIGESEQGYQDLVRAQYVFLLLGLQRLSLVAPGAILSRPSLAGISPERATELRKDAIKRGRPNSLQDRLLRLLWSWRPLVVPFESDLQPP